MRTFGVDISHWEGRIDWQKAAASIGFAYYKCTDGIHWVDDQFMNNQQGCEEVGLAHAPYHYFQPSLDPAAQAEHFISTAGKRYKRYIVDVEAPEREAKITMKLKSFLDRVEQLTATRPVIYTSAGYWNEYIYPKPAWTHEYDLIVAHYTCEHAPLMPAGWKSWRIWQFSDFWPLQGGGTNCDGNWFNGSQEECNDWFGNAATVIDPTPPAEKGFRMRALFDQLHIRQAPNMRARVIGRLEKDETVEVEELGGNDVWVRHTLGWTAVERGGYRYMEVHK